MKDIFTQALEKAINCEELSPVAELTLEKGKKAQIGEIRDWKGQKYQKQASGQWVPVRQGNGSAGKKENGDYYAKNREIQDSVHKKEMAKINDSSTSVEWLEETKSGLERAIEQDKRKVDSIKKDMSIPNAKNELAETEHLLEIGKEELDAINKVLDERKKSKEEKKEGEESSETNKKDKSLSDKLSQIDRLYTSLSELNRIIQDNPDLEKKWNERTGDSSAYADLIGQIKDLEKKVYKEHNISPYIVTYNYNHIYQDNATNKPFYFKGDKKVWLDPTTKVRYLDDRHKSELGDWKPVTVK